jgi:hypothetical protein
MPYFIKGLGDIKEGCEAVGFVFKDFSDFVDDAMCLYGKGLIHCARRLEGAE